MLEQQLTCSRCSCDTVGLYTVLDYEVFAAVVTAAAAVIVTVEQWRCVVAALIAGSGVRRVCSRLSSLLNFPVPFSL